VSVGLTDVEAGAAIKVGPAVAVSKVLTPVVAIATTVLVTPPSSAKNSGMTHVKRSHYLGASPLTPTLSRHIRSGAKHAS
jgi:hypothetical protein